MPPAEPPTRHGNGGRGTAQRLDEDVARDPPADGHLHPMDVDEERPVERTAAGHADRIARVKTEVVQPLTETPPTADIDYASIVAGKELIEGHV